MGFGLVVCWVRGALHCCITNWWRFRRVNQHYIITSWRAYAKLILVPCNIDNGFWLHLSHLWVRGSDVPAVPSFCSGVSGNTFPRFTWQRGHLEKNKITLILRSLSGVRKRKDHHFWALRNYTEQPASCMTPTLWVQCIEKMPCYHLLEAGASFFFLFTFSQDIMGPSPMQLSVNL